MSDELFKDPMVREMMLRSVYRNSMIESSIDLRFDASEELMQWFKDSGFSKLGDIVDYCLKAYEDPLLLAKLLGLTMRDRRALAGIVNKVEPGLGRPVFLFLLNATDHNIGHDA